MAQAIDLKWPGWSEEHNPFGKKFSLNSRKRMVEGSQQLLPFFKKYYSQMGGIFLEYGPFFNPLLTPERFPNKHIFFWERRYKVREFLRKAHGIKITALQAGFTNFKKSSLKALEKRTRNAIDAKCSKGSLFDSVVASQCFNYMDYRAFLSFVTRFCRNGTLLFANNAAGYGVREKFSKMGAQSNGETIEAIMGAGFKVIEKKFLQVSGKKLERIIVVARFEGKN